MHSAARISTKCSTFGWVSAQSQPFCQACSSTATTFCWKMEGSAEMTELININTMMVGSSLGLN